MIALKRIKDSNELKQVFSIREKVFVEEQQVSREEEYDEFEKTATHYLAYYNNVPCGAARWRETENGVKLERFAVLKEFRNKAVGSEILKQVIADITETAPGKQMYLHAQLPAVKFYERQGFSCVGDIFSECNIEHYKMIR